MNYRGILTILLLLCMHITGSAYNKGKMVIRGTECEYDTLVYRTIAPGAKLLQVQFNNIPIGRFEYKMKAHVVIIDHNNKYSSFSPYIARDEYFNLNTQRDQVNRRIAQGLKPVASITGGDFVMSNNTNPLYESYEIQNTLITDSEIKYAENGNNIRHYIDGNGLPHIGNTALNGKVTTANGNTYTIGQVNHCRDRVDSKELISLFCNGIGSSRALDANTGIDVKVKLTNASKILSSKDVTCEVISVSTNCRNTFRDGEAILSGVGKAATFLNSLKEGDKLTINLGFTDASSNAITIQNEMTNHHGYYIKDGVLTNSGQTNTAICTIGLSKDGNTTYWGDMEISDDSNAPAACLLEFLTNIGVYNSMTLDGGPSAEMTVDGKFITVNSTRNLEGRNIASGFILYSTAPDDNTLSHIEVAEQKALTLYRGETATIKVYGYNKYGEMINEDAQTASGVSIASHEGLGTATGGVFTATNIGEGYITITLDGSSDIYKIPVTVIAKNILTANPQKVFTGEGRECQIKLKYTDENGTRDIAPSEATWTKQGRFVLKDCSNGLIIPYSDGEEDVYVEYNGARDTINVKVENLETATEKLDLTDKPSGHTTIETYIPSVPKSFDVNVEGVPGAEVTLSYTLGYNSGIQKKTVVIGDDGKATISVTLDFDDIETYPVYLGNISSSDLTAKISGIFAYYDISSGIKAVATDGQSDKDAPTYNLAGQRVIPEQTKGILISNGKKIIAQ